VGLLPQACDVTPQELFLRVYDRVSPDFQWIRDDIHGKFVGDYWCEIECLRYRWAAQISHNGSKLARVYCSYSIENNHPDFREEIKRIEQIYPTVMFFIWQVRPKQMDYMKIALTV
jgi:hypothetical protein